MSFSKFLHYVKHYFFFIAILYISFVVLIFLLVQPTTFRLRRRYVIYNVSDSLLAFDKKIFEEKFLNNIEYFRKYHIFNEQDYTVEELEAHYKEYPCAEYDPSGFYIGYASRQKSGDGSWFENTIASPMPSKDQLIITTDSIVYNYNATLCVAFMCVEYKYSKFIGLEDKVPKGHEFDAVLMVGVRKNLNDTLKVYPLHSVSVHWTGSHKAAINLLATQASKHFDEGGNYGSCPKKEGVKYKYYNIGEEGFFEDSHFFMHYDDTTYYFQMHVNNRDLTKPF